MTRMTGRALAWAAMIVTLAACDDGGDATDSDAGAGATDGAMVAPDGGAPVDAGPLGDGGAPPPLTLTAVAGDLTFSDLRTDGNGHLYSALADGSQPRRITGQPGYWTHHAVGPDPRYVVAVRNVDADGDGRSDPDGPGEVWILDVKERREYPISPEGCDAGIGGVGWQTALTVLFAMDCGDGPAAAYLAGRDERSRDRAQLLKVSNHAAPVRDVFPAVGTPLFTYVVDVEACAGARCVVKPQVWVGDTEAGLACQVTDGDLDFTDVTTITGGGRRVGDHTPSFTGDLSAVVFSRNVGDKPAGPTGHHDLFSIQIDQRALFRGDSTCAVAGSLTDRTASLSGERYPTADGGEAVGDERFPQGNAGRAPATAQLFTAQTHAGEGTSAVYWEDAAGNRVAVTSPTGRAGYGRWIVTEYVLGGER